MIKITEKNKYLTVKNSNNTITVFNNKNILPIICSEDSGVLIVTKNIISDFKKVSTQTPLLLTTNPNNVPAIIVGTVGVSNSINQYFTQEELDLLIDKWDCFLIKTINESIVIAGSNKRGTIYGLYDFSRKMGVSPLYWLADVPVKNKKNLYIKKGIYFSGEPKIKYRGIFINDEYPCLGKLAHEKFGGFTSEFYTNIFDLILRLKGNYFWPAMWADCFYDDDPKNHELANKLGLIMGTSHHEPMMRSWKEWERYGKGEWDLNKNQEVIKQFWKNGIKRMGTKESLVTVGMRGDGDEPLTEDDQVELLTHILETQRKIIQETTGKQPDEVPQIWAVYKEVQDAYEKGLRVPDDIITLLCDDNWGNLRLLPNKNELKRKGGYGLYYHFDYVGGPRNYKWINTSPIARVWEQLSLAYNNGIKELWIVNVGDIKPLELPLTFFMDFAWDPEEWSYNELDFYTEKWSKEQFGNIFSKEISNILTLYSKYNGRIKPELFNSNTYSIINYREFENVVDEYNTLVLETNKIKDKIHKKYHDTFYELVEYPVKSCANLYKMYYFVALNKLYKNQQRSITNNISKLVQDCFDLDKTYTLKYNNILNGKWNHIASQNHISYTYWQQPEEDIIPITYTLESIKNKSIIGVYLEGEESECFQSGILKPFYRFGQKNYYIEIFNKGIKPFNFYIESNFNWIKFSLKNGEVNNQERIYITVDWDKVMPNTEDGIFTIKSNTEPDFNINISVKAFKQIILSEPPRGTFIESNGIISINANNFSKKTSTNKYNWELIPNLGRTDSAITVFPQVESENSQTNYLATAEYQIYTFEPNKYFIELYISPLNKILQDKELKIAVSLDDTEIRTINIHKDFNWDEIVENSIQKLKTELPISKPGLHTLKIHMINIGVVLQKITLSTSKLPRSFLGPNQSLRV